MHQTLTVTNDLDLALFMATFTQTIIHHIHTSGAKLRLQPLLPWGTKRPLRQPANIYTRTRPLEARCHAQGQGHDVSHWITVGFKPSGHWTTHCCLVSRCCPKTTIPSRCNLRLSVIIGHGCTAQHMVHKTVRSPKLTFCFSYFFPHRKIQW